MREYIKYWFKSLLLISCIGLVFGCFIGFIWLLSKLPLWLAVVIPILITVSLLAFMVKDDDL